MYHKVTAQPKGKNLNCYLCIGPGGRRGGDLSFFFKGILALDKDYKSYIHL